MPQIYFSAYSDDIFSPDNQGERYDNLINIRSIAKLLKAYNYPVTIVGHAAQLLSGARAKTEQTDVLIPLSRQRAEKIKRSLEILGVPSDQISIKAVGGAEPQVENASAEEIWKNRRVEFIINKE